MAPPRLHYSTENVFINIQADLTPQTQQQAATHVPFSPLCQPPSQPLCCTHQPAPLAPVLLPSCDPPTSLTQTHLLAILLFKHTGRQPGIQDMVALISQILVVTPGHQLPVMPRSQLLLPS